MKITVMTADEQIVTLDVDRDESVIPPHPLSLSSTSSHPSQNHFFFFLAKKKKKKSLLFQAAFWILGS